jgi:hypothetical protein
VLLLFVGAGGGVEEEGEEKVEELRAVHKKNKREGGGLCLVGSRVKGGRL